MLKIPTRVRYSVRLAAYLADWARPDEPVHLRQAAADLELSHRYLEQLVVPLKSAGLVKSVSGKRGGYYLAHDAASISVGQVMEAAVGPMRIMDCLDPDTTCRFKDVCAARRMWGLANVRIADVLFEYTVADVSEKKLRSILEGDDQGDEPLKC